MTGRGATAVDGTAGARPSRAWWPALRRVLTVGFVVLIAALLYSQARHIAWGEVLSAVRGYAWQPVAAAAALAALAHAIYSCYDLLGRAWTGHRLPARQVVPVTFVCYAFNLNLGTLVGGFALRYRLYSRLGLGNDAITRVVGLSLVTNWLGYVVLAGAVFALGIIAPPPGWDIGAGALRALGVALLAAGAAYLSLCAFSRRREWTLRGHVIALPPARFALLQLALSCASWLAIAGVPYVLLLQRVPYPTVLGVLLIAALAGVLAHIPAGLGVLEAVFIAMLVPPLPHRDVLAALLAYRAIHYLAPLAIASALYFLLEARARRQAADAGTALADPGHPHS